MVRFNDKIQIDKLANNDIIPITDMSDTSDDRKVTVEQLTQYTIDNAFDLGKGRILTNKFLTNYILKAPNGVATVSEKVITVKNGLTLSLSDGIDTDGTLKNEVYTLLKDYTTDVNTQPDGTYIGGYSKVLDTIATINKQDFYKQRTQPEALIGHFQLWQNIDENKYYFSNKESGTWQQEPSKISCELFEYEIKDNSIIRFNTMQPAKIVKQNDLKYATENIKRVIDVDNMYRTGDISRNIRAYNEVLNMKHSTFDKSKFEIVGAPNITDDGVASGFGENSYVKAKNVQLSNNFKLVHREYLVNHTANQQGLDIRNAQNQELVRFWHRAKASGNIETQVVSYVDGTQFIQSCFLEPNREYEYIIELLNNDLHSIIIDVLTGTVKLDNIVNHPYNFNSLATIYLGSDLSKQTFAGSIDLKQFSISVDGKEVFNGNKTGIDAIKPDNFTKVGNPTISADGIASGFNSGNYIKKDINISNANIDLTCAYYIENLNTLPEKDQTVFEFKNANNDNIALGFRVKKGSCLVAWSIKDGGQFASLYPVHNYKIGNNIIKISTNNNTISLYVNDVLIVTLNNFIPSMMSKLFYGIDRNMADVLTLKNGSIDLNSFKIYVDGNLVYQPMLRIPYTESKTGSKIAPAYCRDRIRQIYQENGYAPYYTLDETEKNVTLPMGELYGMINSLNALRGLAKEGEDRLNTSKGYLTGEVSTDERMVNQLVEMKRSTFDKSKFTVVGAPNITDEGIASKSSPRNAITIPLKQMGNSKTTINTKVKILDMSPSQTYIQYINKDYSQIYSLYMEGDGSWHSQGVYEGSYYPFKSKIGDEISWTINLTPDGIYGTAVVNKKEIYTFRKNMSVNINSLTSWLLGINSNASGDYPSTGLTDLKQFSITVDGKEVFNGNKTGIDVIKPDNFTKVGNPVISADGCVQGFTGNSQRLVFPIKTSLFKNKNWEIISPKISLPFTGECYPILFKFTDGSFGNASYNPSANKINFNAKVGTEGIARSLDMWGQLTKTPKYLIIKIEFNIKIGEYKLYCDYGYGFELLKTQIPLTENKQLTIFISRDVNIEQGSWSGTNAKYDLNYNKYYVDGNLVYQPLLRIPYTESSTGSKIVDGIYRDRVTDVYDQYGNALYYTLDEANKDCTLPMGELYGFVDTKIGNKVSKLGDTMTGSLTINTVATPSGADTTTSLVHYMQNSADLGRESYGNIDFRDNKENLVAVVGAIQNPNGTNGVRLLARSQDTWKDILRGIINQQGIANIFAPPSGNVNGTVLTNVQSQFAENGYCKLGNGLVIEWGHYLLNLTLPAYAESTRYIITLPVPLTYYTPFVTIRNQYEMNIGAEQPNTSQLAFKLHNTSGAQQTVYGVFWMVIGY